MKTKYFRAKPFIPDSDKSWILRQHKKILDTGALIQGKYVSEFENKVKQLVNSRHAVAVTSCGVGLELVLRATGIVGKKFIVPTQTFIASVSCIIRSGNIPVIVDVDKTTQCLSLEIIKQNIDPDVAGIVHVNMAGLISPDILSIRKYCRDNDLFMLTDDAHSFGAKIYDERTNDTFYSGDLGDAGVFSFYPSKIITTAEGGMVTTDDDGLAEKLKILRNHGMVKNDVLVDGLDYGIRCDTPSSNYRMTEFQAVLGLSQIQHVHEWVTRRNEIANLYRRYLEGVEQLTLPPYYSNITQTWWQYIVQLNKEIDRTEVLKEILNKGVPTGNAYWPACHQQTAFEQYISDFSCPMADRLLKQHFSLPMYVELKDEEVEDICNIVKSCI